jgi:hypothetical protein
MEVLAGGEKRTSLSQVKGFIVEPPEAKQRDGEE